MDTQWFCAGVAQPHDKPKMGEDVKPVAFPTKHTTGFLTRFFPGINGFSQKGFPKGFPKRFSPRSMSLVHNGFPQWFTPGSKTGRSKRKTAHSRQAAETPVPLHDPRGQTLDRWEAGALCRIWAI
jgi:hypothetical protein